MKMNICKYLVVCFVSLSILFLALPGHAQSGTLQVKCVEASGAAVQNVKVVVFSMNTQKAKDKKSDAQGVADFGKIDDGVYRVFGGREVSSRPCLNMPRQGGRRDVTLTFAAGDDKKLYFESEAPNRRFCCCRQGLRR